MLRLFCGLFRLSDLAIFFTYLYNRAFCENTVAAATRLHSQSLLTESFTFSPLRFSSFISPDSP